MAVISPDLRDDLSADDIPIDIQGGAAASRHTRRNFLLGSAAFAAGLGVYSGEIARHELDVTHRTFQIRRLPTAFDGFRIIQISDIHLEEFTEEFFLERVVRRINQMKPDLVLITGDFITNGSFTYGRPLEPATRCGALLSALTCPHRYGIFGNHDAGAHGHIVRDQMEKNGVPLLVNQHLRIERGGQHIWLAGTDDALNGLPNLDQALPASPDAPVILMAHEPDFANVIFAHPRAKNLDVVLSGHTHGGQVRLPGMAPFRGVLPVGGKAYPEGHFTLGNFQLYVNRGLGTVGVPFRLNCPPELTEITLRPALGA
jgi:predicted MPP superfamily phosphohydrolase